MSSPEHAILLYDGDCPFCSEASKYYQLREAFPQIEIVSLRDTGRVKELQIPANVDFNLGMILLLPDGSIHQGNEALHKISQSLPTKGFRDHFMKTLGSRRWVSKITYPTVFALRKLFFKFTGKSSEITRNDLHSFFILVALFTAASSPQIFAMGSDAPDCKITQTQKQLADHIDATIPPPIEGIMPSASAHLVNAQGDLIKVLYEKNSFNQQEVSSVQKVLTAYVAIKSGIFETAQSEWKPIDEFYDKEGSQTLLLSNGKHPSLGEMVYAKDLIHSLLDLNTHGASLAISRATYQDTSSFVKVMNETAQEMLNDALPHLSYFQNPAGLSDTDPKYVFGDPSLKQHSTAHQMARVLARSLADADFRKLLAQNGVPEVAHGEMVKYGSSPEAGTTLIAQFPFPNCPTLSLSLALFGEGTPAQKERFKTFLGDLRRGMGYPAP